ncbi:MAG TPA: NAD-dependent epimerase/dehydratase family protein [Thermoanaerobaculia bacterium]
MKRALLTGGAGFVGANLARRLLAEGLDVHLLVRPESRGWRIEGIRRDVRIHAVDLSEAESVSKAVRAAAPDWIFHLAAHGSYSSQTDLDRMIQTNLAGTATLLEACARIGFEAFVHAGSSSEYGYKDHAPAEEDWLEPNSPYAVTKAAATLFCRYQAQKLELPITTLRLYSVYGPYEEPTRLMPTLIRAGLAGKLPPLVHPDIARDYVYTEDVNEAFLLAAQRASAKSRGAVYNVGTGIQTTIREVVAVARRTLPISEEPRWGSMPDRQWDTGVWVADRRRIERELGWKPHVPLEEGFARMVEWVRENPTLAEPR